MEARLINTLGTFCRLCERSVEELHPHVGVLGDLMGTHIADNDRQSRLLCDVCTLITENWDNLEETCQGDQENFRRWKNGRNSELQIQEKEEDVDALPGDVSFEMEMSDDTAPNHRSIFSEQSLDTEILSPLENSYIDKCKAMVEMYQSFKCACHSATFRNLKGLLTHLRTVKIWFPIFTCYNCMITFTDRSSSGKHFHKCPKENLDTLVKLSNLGKRSTLKTRIYQNYRCIECKFRFSFHEDFCKHVDEEHCDKISPYNCNCQKTFYSLEEYKNHIYVSCMVEYYCDICDISVGTLTEFINHSRNKHDNSEGFALLQDDSYKKRTILGKRRSSTFSQTLDNDQTDDDIQHNPKQLKSSNIEQNQCPQCDKIYSNRFNMLRHLETHQQGEPEKLELERTTEYHRCPDSSIEPNQCPQCDKIYSSRFNMLRHLKTHQQGEPEKLELERTTENLRCPDSNKKPNQCPQCDKIYSNRFNMLRHLETHQQGEPEKLELERTTDNHRCSDSDIKSNQCPQCDKIYSSRFNMLRHLKTHQQVEPKKLELEKTTENHRCPDSNKKPNQCPQCDKIYSSQFNMLRHLKTHQQVEPKKLELEKTTENHKCPDSNKEPNQCPHCDEIYSGRFNMLKHLETHQQGEPEKLELERTTENLRCPDSNKKPNQCPQCDKIYSSRFNMLKHLETHQQGESEKLELERTTENHRCPDCQVIFCSADWESHKQSHESIRCSECEDEFMFRSELEQHRLLHFNSEGYKDSNKYSHTMLNLQPRLPDEASNKNVNEEYDKISEFVEFSSEFNIFTTDILGCFDTSYNSVINFTNALCFTIK